MSSTRLSHRLEYALFCSLKTLIRLTPKPLLSLWQGLLFHLLYTLFRVCRKEVDTNLSIAFPDKTPQERQSIAKASYKWLARIVIETLRMDQWTQTLENTITYENFEVLEEALAEEKGVLLLGAHLGNWEAFAGLSLKGYPTYLYVADQSNPLIQEHQNQRRALPGVHLIKKDNSAKLAFLKALSGKNIVTMLVDQNDRKSSLFVNFFGKLASMSRGAAVFHLARKSPIVLAIPPFDGDQTKLIFRRLHIELSGDREADTQNVSQVIAEGLEAFIREYPEQYFWMHRRWRTRPPEDPESVY